LLEEIRAEFRESGKECAVKFILKRPANKGALNEPFVQSDTHLEPATSEWHETFVQNRLKIERLLYIGHPLMCEILELWTRFHSTRIIDIEKIKSQKDPYRIFSFKSFVMVHAEKCRTKLWNDWLESILKLCTDTFLRKKRGPRNTAQAFLLKSLQTLLKVQVLSIMNSSLEDYFSLFTMKPLTLEAYGETVANENKPPHFSTLLNFVEKTKVIEFDPPLAEIEEALTECVSLLVSTLSYVPNFEKTMNHAVLQLPVPLPGSELDRKEFEPPIILLTDTEQCRITVESAKIEALTKYLRNYASSCFEMATEYLERYQKYKNLFSSEVSKEVATFLAEEHTFDEYAAVPIY
jgi:dynein heavy chain, axonemal